MLLSEKTYRVSSSALIMVRFNCTANRCQINKGEPPENAPKPRESPQTASEGERKGEIDITVHEAAGLVA